MPNEPDQVLPKILGWLSDLAERIRIGHPNNAPYAHPYVLAVNTLEQGDPEPARDILECHRANAVNGDNFAKYSAWLHHLNAVYR